MNKWYETEVTCPYCHKKVKHNILTSFFHARVECPHCEYGLIVRFKRVFNTIVLLVGLLSLILFEFVKPFGLFERILIALVWVFALELIAALIFVKIKGWDYVYNVDMEDPTVLLHKKKK